MAAAEARAVWQRTANRCFVQEDAKRAPKLACCQSSSPSSKQADAGSVNAADGPYHPAVGFMPFNRNPSSSNLPRDTRWWLQLQPGNGFQKGLTYEQLNSLEAEVEALRAGITSKISEVHPQNEGNRTHADDNTNCETSRNVHYGVSDVCMKKDPKVRKEEMKAICSKNSQEFLDFMDLRENYELMGMDPVGSAISKQPNESCFDPETPWIGTGKTEPWWRMTDRDELASMVAQKSLDHVENCDLPPPQKMNVRRNPYTHLGCLDHDELLVSSLDWKAQSSSISSPTVHTQGSSDSGSKWASVEEDCSRFGSDKSFGYGTTHKDMKETRLVSESDPGKAQLLEALRHSQTRAREAEKAAKQAYAEKEHIIKLFFRQASQLFAYKQWFQLLQLETLYLQIKNNDQPISTLFPVVFPWMPYKSRKLRKRWQKAAKGKQGRPRHDITKYAVAFALGLSLVSAGLLLGWTVGWMLPPF